MQNDETFYTRAIYAALSIAIIGITFYWSFLIIKSFIMMILWGIIISVTLYPVFKKLVKEMEGREKLPVTITTVVGLAALIVPSKLIIDSTVSLNKAAQKMDNHTFRIKLTKEKVAGCPVMVKPVFETWELFSVNLNVAFKYLNLRLGEWCPKIIIP